MENKYYKPSIEEFHIGFEFEINSTSKEDGWLQCSLYSLTDSVFNATYGADGVMKTISVPDCIRVKYLDKEDIESLGFEYTSKSIDIWFKKEGDFDMGSWTAYECTLHYGLHDNRLHITVTDAGEETTIFKGIIKNKSTLKVLLKQLGITES